jgi:hypothetical protein
MSQRGGLRSAQGAAGLMSCVALPGQSWAWVSRHSLRVHPRTARHRWPPGRSMAAAPRVARQPTHHHRRRRPHHQQHRRCRRRNHHRLHQEQLNASTRDGCRESAFHHDGCVEVGGVLLFFSALGLGSAYSDSLGLIPVLLGIVFIIGATWAFGVAARVMHLVSVHYCCAPDGQLWLAALSALTTAWLNVLFSSFVRTPSRTWCKAPASGPC